MLGIGPQWYSHIYILFVSLLSIVVIGQYSSFSQSRIESDTNSSSIPVFFLALLLIFFIGLRPISGKYFIDMAGYNLTYNNKLGEPFVFDWNATNKLFDNFLAFFASNNVPIRVFFLIIATIYFGGIGLSCALLFPKDKFASFLVYLAAFSTFSYGTNGMKAGMAASLFLVAIALYEKRKYLWMAVFVLLSWGFHHSMVLPVTAFIICLVFRNPKWYFAFWAFCLLMAILHISYFQFLFAGFTDEHGADYLLGEGVFVRHNIMGGFRIDFIIYSLAPIIVGWIVVVKKRVLSRVYCFLLNLYLLTNATWLLCMYAEFTNRIAYLSWFLLPIVLIYPFLNEVWGERQYNTFQIIAFAHLGFTIFMQYIYY